MTRKKLEQEKKRLLNKKPVLDLDVLTYQAEMAEWDSKLSALELEEARLGEIEAFRKLEAMGMVANLERRRSNRLESIELLKKKHLAIGMRLNRAKNYKAKQWAIAMQIVEMEAEIHEFTETIDNLIEEMIQAM